MTNRERRAVVFAFAFAVAAALAGAGCKKRAGSACKGAEAVCQDKKTALLCRDDAFVEVACAGPTGCAKFQDRASCDTSVAERGDLCMDDEDEYACSSDGARALVCKTGRFEPYLECRGASGCAMVGRSVSCDTSIAEKNDPCRTEGAIACGVDRKHMLVCRDGRFALHRYCRGRQGCSSEGEAPSCDETLSLAGDPCGLPGQVVCSVDGKTELVCQGGIFTKALTCKTACTVSDRPGRPIDCR